MCGNAQSGNGPASVTATVGLSPGGGSCAYSLAPASQVIPAAGGTGNVGILTEAGCPWTGSLSSGSSFLSIISGTGGSGPNDVEFRATANTTAATQTGTLTIAGLTATIIQPGTAPLLLHQPHTPWQFSTGSKVRSPPPSRCRFSQRQVRLVTRPLHPQRGTG